MHPVIYKKFYSLENSLFYNRMVDTTLQIKEVMKDSFQLQMNELTMTKVLTEDVAQKMRALKINPNF